MSIHPKWITTNDQKQPNGWIHQPNIDNGSTMGENNVIPIKVNEVPLYIPFHSEHVTYTIFVSTLTMNHSLVLLKLVNIRQVILHVGFFQLKHGLPSLYMLFGTPIQMKWGGLVVHP
jgi:hypothetical protein